MAYLPGILTECTLENVLAEFHRELYRPPIKLIWEHEGERVDITYGGTVRCARAISEVLVRYAYEFKPVRRALCKAPHSTVSALWMDLVDCGWQSVWPHPEPIPGDILFYPKITTLPEERQTEHVGIYLGRGFAASTHESYVTRIGTGAPGTLVKHRWQFSADNITWREPKAVLRHQHLEKQVPSYLALRE
jgi:hypothetical protein